MPGVDVLASAFNGANAAYIADAYARWATDPGSVADFEAFARQTGHQLVEHSESGGVYRFLLMRAA